MNTQERDILARSKARQGQKEGTMNAAAKNVAVNGTAAKKRRTTKPAAKPKPAPAATPSDLGPETKPAAATKSAIKPAKKANGSVDLAAMDNDALREHLLSHVTISDSRWTGSHGNPARKDKESRADFINRVLA